jgi:mannose-6-phosphate isomerase-like protein (cupin superfamily)
MQPAHQFYIRTIPRSVQLDKEKRWNFKILFNVSTGIMEKYQAIFGAIDENAIPHLVHQHPEEELIIPLSGSLEIFRHNDELHHGHNGSLLLPGFLIYLPARDPHMLRGKGPDPSIVVAIRWKGNRRGSTDGILTTSMFDIPENPSPSHHGPPKVSRIHIFEGATDYAENLRAHSAYIKPGGGYGAHTHPHDLMMLLLEGRLDTMHMQVPSPALLFFPAGTSHWARNTGKSPASLLTFEFHTLLQ